MKLFPFLINVLCKLQKVLSQEVDFFQIILWFCFLPFFSFLFVKLDDSSNIFCCRKFYLDVLCSYAFNMCNFIRTYRSYVHENSPNTILKLSGDCVEMLRSKWENFWSYKLPSCADFREPPCICCLPENQTVLESSDYWNIYLWAFLSGSD